MEKEDLDQSKGERLLAAGGVVGAVAASSCCVLPLLFVSIGISGAWIGMLTKLAPYQPLFLAVAAVCIGAGFWSVYGRQRLVCGGPECGTARSRRATKVALWAGVAILVVVATVGWWAKLLN